jgi:TRAP-type uncharacterized transport system fused permease subunit
MKKCPHCQKQAITLYQWGQGLNGFRTRCKSCGKKLKATTITYWLALLCFVAILAAVFQVIPAAKKEGFHDFTIRELIVLPIAVAICLVAYPFCGYKKDE